MGYDSSTNQVRIGMNPIGGIYVEYFDGRIDEVMVFDSALSSAEIQEVYSQTG